MAFSWKKFTIFGFCLAVPIVAFIVKNYVDEEQAAAFKRMKAEIAECNRCHKLFGVRAGMSFILHLQDAHKIPADDSIYIVSELYRQLIARKGKR